MNTVIEGKEILHVLLVSKIRLWKPRGAETKEALLRHFNYVFSDFSIYTIYSLHYLQFTLFTVYTTCNTDAGGSVCVI